MDRLGVKEKRGLIRALSELQLAVGDSVVVGVREDALLRGALLVYLFPLIALIVSALVASTLSLDEPYVISTGLAGFFASWLVVRNRGRKTEGDTRLQPVVLRAMIGSTSGSAC
jgi:sigma-E factor negative regulatory protein RseC